MIIVAYSGPTATKSFLEEISNINPPMKIDYSPHEFELNVLSLLQELCTKEEPIFTDYLVSTNNHPTPRQVLGGGAVPIVDFYLPEGCKAMDWKKPCCVEAKSQLTSTALGHLRRLSETVSVPIKVVTEEDYSHSGISEKLLIESNRVEWYSLGAIYRKIENIKQNKAELKQDNLTQQTDDDKSTEADNTPTINEADSKELARNGFKNGNITLFLGAGVSVGAGLPQWDTLLKELLKDKNQYPLGIEDYPAIDVAAYNSNLIAARYLLFPYSGGKEFEGSDILRDALYRNYSPDEDKLELINTIVDICNAKNDENQRYVSSIITFNYDDLVEKAMKKKKIPYVSIDNDKKYELGKLPIIHVHGILSKDESNPLPILSEESYHRLYDTFNSITNVEIVHALYRNTCIFVGLSMTDPNLRRLLESVKIKKSENLFHYAIMPEVSLDYSNWDAASPTRYYKENEDKNKEFRKRQERVFESLGIKIIWFPQGKYEEIPKILREIAGLDKKEEINEEDSKTEK